MHSKDRVVNHGSQRQIVKHVGEIAPHIGRAKLARTLGEKTVHLRDLARLVIAAQQSDAMRIAQFQNTQQRDGFNTVISTIDKIAQKQVVDVRRRTRNLENLQQVVKLPLRTTKR